MIHIGKTGGSVIKHALESLPPNERYDFQCYTHHTRLKKIPVGDHCFFFLRDPISRFISGFNSRKRQGKPLYFYEWKPGERIAFETFHSPNELALALSHRKRAHRLRANQAMNKIRHVKRSYWYWFRDESYFRSRLDDLFFIGFQETLNADFEILKKKLSLPEDLSLSNDEVIAHKNPDHLDKHLDDQAIENLKQWYAKDYEFMDLCREIIQERGLDQPVPLFEDSALSGR
ncbi:MAG: sulfotransferase family 2 domain-containing protein [Planctomycetota bacterium]|nr:sulfotransferase family 2 domain-containing protein [Planctomycetota bacterium]